MKRYPPTHVSDALEETDRLTFTPHSQIVLAAEVRALRELLSLEQNAAHAHVERLRQMMRDIIAQDTSADAELARKAHGKTGEALERMRKVLP